MAGQKTENEKNHLLVCLSTPVPQHPMLNFLSPDKTEKKPFKRRLKTIIFCDMTQEELLAQPLHKAIQTVLPTF